MMHSRWMRAAGAATMMTWLLVGCGDSGDDSKADTAKDAGGKTDLDASGDKTDGATSTGKQDAGGPVVCGDKTCSGVMAFAACCTDKGAGVKGDPLEFTGRAPNLCGVDLGAFLGQPFLCLQVKQPGTLDPSCPKVPSPAGEMMGCCTDEGFCGGMESGLGLGCMYGEGGRGAGCGANKMDAGAGNDASVQGDAGDGG